MRKCLVWCGFVALCCGMAGPAGAGSLDEGLVQVLEVTPPGQSVSTIVFLSDQVDISALNASLDRERATLQRRHEVVVRALQEKAQATQGALRDYLKALQYAGRIDSFEAFWINNSFRVEAKPAELQLLARRADVGTIYFNYPIEQIQPVGAAPGGAEGGRTPEPGLVAINAPQVWAMGITGDGVVVSTLDTGVDGNHPALHNRWRGLDPRYAGHGGWAFFDPVTHQTTPFDSGYHGTHTMGTVCGGAPGDQIGVAPGAQWINAAVIDRVSLLRTCTDAVLAFQWLIDPDGNPNTNWDVPTSCSNSWGIGNFGIPPWSNPCDSSFWSYIDACEAAGIVVLFSAGNEGPGPNSLRRPADRATDEYRNLAVAAVDGNQNYPWPIASFSSRGPTYCTPNGTAAIKPEVSAPGVHVRSAAPGGSYQYLDGTSMASPHVNGVVALMRQACPDLSVQEVKQILYQTARDLGTPGNDNDYGYGMIDAYQAVLLAQGMCGPKPPKADDGSYETPVDTPVLVQLNATDYDHGPLPMVFIITDLPSQTLTDVGNGHVIAPGDVPYTLVNNGNHVTYTPSGGFYGTDVFHFKANDGGTPPTGGDSNIATITVLVKYGPPVITTTTLPVGCVAHPYGPFQLKASQGQPPLTWSIVTGQYAETDVGSCQFAVVGTPKGWQADDNSWSYTLPFSFPFFGQTYTSCWVCSNGFIDFASNSNQWLNTDAELIANKRIALCWEDLKTNQTGGDIFIEAAGDHVTFRWNAAIYGNNLPVNISATLYPDGKIRFNYGPGNTGLLTPTIGISGGDGTHYLLSTYNHASNLTNANSHDFALLLPLPNGVTLSPSGLLSGTPTQSGTFTPQFKVVDSFGRSDQKQISLTVNATCSFVLGDMNCDGVVNFLDIDPFVLALSGAAGYYDQYPNCYYYNADCNNDGKVDFADIDPFVALLTH